MEVACASVSVFLTISVYSFPTIPILYIEIECYYASTSAYS